jgi:hypothetical protein
MSDTFCLTTHMCYANTEPRDDTGFRDPRIEREVEDR